MNKPGQTTHLAFLLIFMFISPLCMSENNTRWAGKSAAVVLTYDDSLNIHLDQVIPALDKRDMKGTFYLTLSPAAFSERVQDWRKAAKTGHELGNHTLFHPCSGSPNGRSWVAPEYDLDSYSIKRITEELKLTNDVLHYVDGKTERTLAYTCGDTLAGDKSFIPEVKTLFPGARGVANSFSSPDDVDLYNINAYMAHNVSGDVLISLAQQAIKEHKLVVFLFHGVGGEHNLNVSTEAHEALLNFLDKNRKDVWVAPMLDVVQFLKKEH